jgi:hypothetical protein
LIHAGGVGSRYLSDAQSLGSPRGMPRRNSAAEAAGKDDSKDKQQGGLRRLMFHHPDSLQHLLDEETGKGVDNEGDPFEALSSAALRSLSSSSAVVSIVTPSPSSKAPSKKKVAVASLSGVAAKGKAGRIARFQELQRGTRGDGYGSEFAAAFASAADEAGAAMEEFSSPLLLSTGKGSARASIVKQTSAPTGSTAGGTVVVVAPFGFCGVLCCRPRAFARNAKTSDDLVDSSLALTSVSNWVAGASTTTSAAGTSKKAAATSSWTKPLISPAYPIIFFTGSGFRPSKFFFLQLDWAFIVITGALNTWIQEENSTAKGLTARGAVIFTLALLLAFANFVCLPDALVSSQQLPMRLLIIILSGISALYTGLASAGPPSSADGLAYIVVILCLLLPLVLLLSFYNMLATSARKEKKDGETEKRAFVSAQTKVRQVLVDIAAKRQKEAEAAAAAAVAKKGGVVAPSERIYVSSGGGLPVSTIRQWQQQQQDSTSGTSGRSMEEGRIYVGGGGAGSGGGGVLAQRVLLINESKEGLENQYRGIDGAFQALNPLTEAQAQASQQLLLASAAAVAASVSVSRSPASVAPSMTGAMATTGTAGVATSTTTARGSVVSLNPLAARKR